MTTTKELEDLMGEYRERFEDVFPLYCCMGMSTEAIVEAVKECLKQGKPFEVDTEADY